MATPAVGLELGPLRRDVALTFYPGVLLANALAAFALNLVRGCTPPLPLASRRHGTVNPPSSCGWPLLLAVGRASAWLSSSTVQDAGSR